MEKKAKTRSNPAKGTEKPKKTTDSILGGLFGDPAGDPTGDPADADADIIEGALERGAEEEAVVIPRKEFEIAQIKDKNDGKYLIEWKDYKGEDTWETKEDLIYDGHGEDIVRWEAEQKEEDLGSPSSSRLGSPSSSRSSSPSSRSDGDKTPRQSSTDSSSDGGDSWTYEREAMARGLLRPIKMYMISIDQEEPIQVDSIKQALNGRSNSQVKPGQIFEYDGKNYVKIKNSDNLKNKKTKYQIVDGKSKAEIEAILKADEFAPQLRF